MLAEESDHAIPLLRFIYFKLNLRIARPSGPYCKFMEVFFMQQRTNNSSWTTRMLTEGAILIALSFVLGRIKLFEMPQGGSITAGQMIPLIIFAIRHGWQKGMIIGAVYGVIDMLIGGYVMHPVQAILDYPLAFGVLGLAGLYSAEFMRTREIKPVLAGTAIGVFARFICHLLTGVIFFASYAPETQGPLLYSIVYNGSFLLVEFIITVVIIYLLRNFISRDVARV